MAEVYAATESHDPNEADDGARRQAASALAAPATRHDRAIKGADPRPYPVDTGPALGALMQQYRRRPEPITVSFRKLVPWIKVGERATHYIHPYPAKLLPHIAHFFLASNLLVGRRETVLDPFAGTGTVALETILSGRAAIHADANPLARLIATTKTTVVPDAEVAKAAERIRALYAASRRRRLPDVVNLGRWFEPATAARLVRLKDAVEQIEHGDLSDLLRVTFSAVVRRSSLADPRFSVPVRRRPGDPPPPGDVLALFLSQLEGNRRRSLDLAACKARGTAAGAGADARRLLRADGSGPLPDGSMGMVLTSPPYAGAQKYVRASSLSLGWLGLVPSNQLRTLEDATIGREHFPKASTTLLPSSGLAAADGLVREIAAANPLRAAIVATYLVEMRDALAEAVRVLRPCGHMVLVIGDNTVCGRPFPSSDFLPAMLEGMGMSVALSLVDAIHSRTLMTNRATSAAMIRHESVIVLRKN